MSNTKITTAQKYLLDFSRSMSNRSLSIILFSDFFKKSFEWDLKTWRKDMQYLDGGSESLEMWSQYSQLNNILGSIFDAILNRVLVEQTMDYYYFFDQFSKHIEKYRDEKIRVKERDHMYAEHYVIKRPWIFGLAGRMRSFSGPVDDNKKFEEDIQKHMRAMDEIEKEKTFDLVIALGKMGGVFNQTFTKENLKKFISEAKALEDQYSPDSLEEHRRVRFLELFSDLLKFIESKEQPSHD